MKKSVVVALFMVMVLSGVLVLIFQNCSGALTPQSNVVTLQSIADIDSSAIPQLLSSADYVYRKTNGQLTLDKSPSLSESSSAVIVFDRAMSGNIYRYYANDSVDEARVSVETNGMIRLWHISNGNNYAYAEAPLPDLSVGNQVTVGASFGIASGAMVLLVNGLKQNLTIQKVGSPFDFSYVQKTTVLNGANGKVLDVMTFSSLISNLDLNVMSRYLARGVQVTNVAFDPSLPGDTSIGGGTKDSPEFLAAKAVIDGNCLSCHNGSNYGDFRNLTQAQFISKGLVVAQDLTASKIYYRLAGAMSGPGPANMPQGGALSAVDVAKIAAWINSIQ